MSYKKALKFVQIVEKTTQEKEIKLKILTQFVLYSAFSNDIYD
jgi:hypothetical protein